MAGQALYTAQALRVLADASEALAGLERVGDPRQGRVSLAGTPTPRPFEVVVRELPESVTVSDPSTSRAMGQRACAPLSVEWSVGIQMWSTRARAEDAAADVALWWELVSVAVAADRTLGGLCLHATPYYTSGGTGMRDAQFIAAIDCGVRVASTLPQPE